MATLYAFTAEQVKLIAEVVRKVIGDEFHIPEEMFSRSRQITHTKEGILDGTLSAGGSATMSIYTKPNGTWTDTTDNLTVTHADATIGPEIAAGTWVLVLWINGEWRPIAADC